MDSLKTFIETIISDGVLTTEEHDELMKMILADGKIDSEEQAQISYIFDLIKNGKLSVVDPDREAADKKRKEDLKKAVLTKA